MSQFYDGVHPAGDAAPDWLLEVLLQDDNENLFPPEERSLRSEASEEVEFNWKGYGGVAL